MPTQIKRPSLDTNIEARYNNAAAVGSAGGNAKKIETNGGYSPLRNSMLEGMWTKAGFKTKMASQQSELIKPEGSSYVAGFNNRKYKG